MCTGTLGVWTDLLPPLPHKEVWGAGPSGIEVSRGLRGTDLLTRSGWRVWGLTSGRGSGQQSILASLPASAEGAAQPCVARAGCPPWQGVVLQLALGAVPGQLAPSQPEIAPPARLRQVTPARSAHAAALHHPGLHTCSAVRRLVPLSITCDLLPRPPLLLGC